MCGKRKTQIANDNDLISVSLKSFAPLPLEGADERSEAGLASLNVGVPFHAANLRPFGAPPSKGRREKKGADVFQSPSLLVSQSLAPIHHKAPDRKISDQGLSMRSHQRLSKNISRS